VIWCAIDGCGGREDEVVDVVASGVDDSVGFVLLKGLGKATAFRREVPSGVRWVAPSVDDCSKCLHVCSCQ
jgi:hypothetical protein